MHCCCPDTKALILTAYDDNEYIIALMEAGAHGYLLKTAQPNEVIEAVRSIHSGEMVFHPAIAAKVAQLWAQNRMFAQWYIHITILHFVALQSGKLPF